MKFAANLARHHCSCDVVAMWSKSPRAHQVWQRAADEQKLRRLLKETFLCCVCYAVGQRRMFLQDAGEMRDVRVPSVAILYFSSGMSQ